MNDTYPLHDEDEAACPYSICENCDRVTDNGDLCRRCQQAADVPEEEYYRDA